MKNTDNTNTNEPCETEDATPQFVIHKFMEEITERKIIFQVIKMLDSLFIYINDKDHPHFNNLALAMTNRFSDSPIGTSLLGSFPEDISKNIACRVSKKINKPVYLSCNIEQDRFLIPLVEKRLYEEIKVNPDKF